MKQRFILALLSLLFTFQFLNAQWVDVSTTGTYTLTNASFVDDNIGFVMADGYPFIYRTTNGGASWDSLVINQGVGAIDIDFISPDTGFVLVDSGAVHMIKTTFDGGNSWSSDTLPAGNYYRMIRFTSATTGYAATMFAYIYKTTNGGANWTQLPIETGYSSAADKELTGPDTIIFTGADGTFGYQGSVISSVNGGGSFQEHVMPTPYSQFNGTYFLSGATGFATFTNDWTTTKNYLTHTSDGGLSWDTVLTDATDMRIFTDVLMINATEGYMTIEDGISSFTILQVNGNTTALDYTANFLLKRMYKAGNTAFAIGEGGTVVKKALPLGIETSTITPLKDLYPNPTKDQVFISIDTQSTITILDMAGKVVQAGIFIPGEPISLGSLAGGIYVLKMSNENGIYTGKVIVEK